MSGGYSYRPGTKLMVELAHGEKYTGNVRDCDENQITLVKVYDHLTQTEGKSNCPQHFYRIEIRNTTVLEEVPEENSDQPPQSYYEIHRGKLEELIRNFIFMTEKNEQFNNALECIKKCNVISIAALVTYFGKGQRLTLLGVGTPEQVFIFDLKSMGPTAFENGLKQILESNTILKVVHASKLLTESLSYQHNVSLRYTFDTELADMAVSFRANNTETPEPRYLKQCLWFYFDAPKHVTQCFYVNFMTVHRRPLSEYYKKSMATQTVYLLRLKQHLQEQIIHGYVDVRENFLNTRREGTLGDSWKMGTKKTASRLRDFEPEALEHTPRFVADRKLTVDQSTQTSEPTSTDDDDDDDDVEVVRIDQSLMPLALSDEEADDFESCDSAEMDEIIQKTILLHENRIQNSMPGNVIDDDDEEEEVYFSN